MVARLLLCGMILLLGAGPALADPMATAQAFLDGLSPEQRAKAVQPFEARNRQDWYWVPRDRAGISLKEMGPEQRERGFAMAGAVLSETGLAKARAIIARESVLARTEGASFRDPERYWFAVFGTPGDAAGWGWRLEGHHLSLNVTLRGSEVVSTTPAFTGANPSVMPDNTLMGPEQQLARELLKSLDGAQRGRAVTGTRVPGGFMIGQRRIEPPIGLPAAAMTEPQRGLLRRLIAAYVESWRADIAAREVAAIEASLGETHFAWAGGAEAGQDHYYRIQGPALLIEHDNSQARANHIHAFWRSPRDFGR
ncbi:DUF3500 domain-containing protein [Desertibaculum subflavum]|uniref:DUF3500 domain-containing protein n=1 Tax=Desertibaculum subflavum TaxID=2268458 RepID=UPI0013C43442